jgi:hypothetical protein
VRKTTSVPLVDMLPKTKFAAEMDAGKRRDGNAATSATKTTGTSVPKTTSMPLIVMSPRTESTAKIDAGKQRDAATSATETPLWLMVAR